MKSLVIAEKPSVGRDLARVLNCKINKNGCLENDKYIVTWALGHLITLKDPESYSDIYKEWKMETLPMLPKHLELTVIKKTGKQFQVVKKQLLRDDVNEIIIATDAGREGELVARWIIDYTGVKKPMKRLWISSITDQAIKNGFANLKDSKDYDNLYRAAKARAEADWLVGLNATRALTVKHNAQLSCGRVQTPTLAIVQAHNEAIRQFKPQSYYGLTANILGKKFIWHDKNNQQTRIFSKERVNKIFEKVQGKEVVIKNVEKKTKKTFAPLLYDLTELQRDANRLYQFSAKETLNYMQRLYEHHKVLTYPRTDARYITTDMVDTLAQRVKACSGGDWSGICSLILRQGRIQGASHFVNNAKVSDHHAIIPTEQGIRLNELEYGERKIYELVVKRFLAVLLPPYVYEETKITAEIQGELFNSSFIVTIEEGWHQILEQKDTLSEAGVCKFKANDHVEAAQIIITEGKTEPPAFLTEATLLSAMENPSKYMDDLEGIEKKTLNETGGLGTVATRADIIEKLFSSGMLEKRNQYIHLTSKGRQVLELAPSELRSPKLTAQWEQKLSDIADGKLYKKNFEAEIREYTVQIVDQIKNSSSTYKHDNITGKKCPECGKLLLLNKTKNGSSLVCQDRNCGYRKNLEKVTNARCPNCHKKLMLAGEGESKKFVCAVDIKKNYLHLMNEKRKLAVK